MLNYEEFLRRKALVSPPTGIEPPDDINPSLFPFQGDTVRWGLRRGRAAIFAGCGMGKTAMQLEWARCIPGDVLVLAPLAVAQQTVEEGKKFDIDVSYCREMSEVEAGITVTNYEMLDRFDPGAFAGVVLDECFAPETLVDVVEGSAIERRPISKIRVGDRVLNASGVDEVSDVHRREVKFAVRVSWRGERIVCSPNHPFYTQRGWVGAQDLEPEDRIVETAAAVRLVRGDLLTEVVHGPILRNILLSEMADAAAQRAGEGSLSGGGEEARRSQESVVCVRESRSREGARQDQRPEPDDEPGEQGEVLPPIESHEAQTFRAWGEWPGVDRAAIEAAGCAWRELGSGIRHITGHTDSWVSDVLQGRLGARRAEAGHRGGWVLPPFQEASGSEKGRETGFVRLEGVEILEQGHPDLDRYRDADGRVYFYDLGGTRHPSFSVNGCLVHNSSILKSQDSKTRTALIEAFRGHRFRLACTATPAPNDYVELANHAEFLGVMTRSEMLSTWFVHDGGDTQSWRLKGHAERDFWRWVCSWAVMLRMPSDLGYEDGVFQLPPLEIHEHVVASDPMAALAGGTLFAAQAQTLVERRQARKSTVVERVALAAELANAGDEQWLVWCNLNAEGDALTRAIRGAVQVSGADSNEDKQERMLGFVAGKYRVMVSKPSICGFGMNFQHCGNVAFVGLSDSWESYYQAIRRCWRFGRTGPVRCHVITSDIEGAVVANIKRKEADAEKMVAAMLEQMRATSIQNVRGATRETLPYRPERPIVIPDWLRGEAA